MMSFFSNTWVYLAAGQTDLRKSLIRWPGLFAVRFHWTLFPAALRRRGSERDCAESQSQQY